jgi:hypothetical protein
MDMYLKNKTNNNSYFYHDFKFVGCEYDHKGLGIFHFNAVDIS